MSPDDKLQDIFLVERNQIFQEIHKFLFVVRWHLVDIEKGDHSKNSTQADIARKITSNFNSFIDCVVVLYKWFIYGHSTAWKRDFEKKCRET